MRTVGKSCRLVESGELSVLSWTANTSRRPTREQSPKLNENATQTLGHWPAVAGRLRGSRESQRQLVFVVISEVSPRGRSPSAWSAGRASNYFGKISGGASWAEVREKAIAHGPLTQGWGRDFTETQFPKREDKHRNVTWTYFSGGGIIGDSFSLLRFCVLSTLSMPGFSIFLKKQNKRYLKGKT